MINDIYFEQFPQLESERLILRKFNLSDAGHIHDIRTNDTVMRYMDSKKHKDLKESEEFIAQGLDTYARKQGLFWAIIEKESGAFVGDFSFWRIDRKNSRGEIGYTLKAAFWGKGYMTEVVKQTINFGFDRLNLHSIEANINPVNANSRKLLIKAGFRKEAYFRENYFFDGKYLDSEIYSLLRADFTYADNEIV